MEKTDNDLNHQQKDEHESIESMTKESDKKGKSSNEKQKRYDYRLSVKKLVEKIRHQFLLPPMEIDEFDKLVDHWMEALVLVKVPVERLDDIYNEVMSDPERTNHRAPINVIELIRQYQRVEINRSKVENWKCSLCEWSKQNGWTACRFHGGVRVL